jgi:predicted Zn-dependent protease
MISRCLISGHIPDIQAWSVADYISAAWSNNEPGRHGSYFNLESKPRYPHEHWVTTVAHELGHVFGFWHVNLL